MRGSRPAGGPRSITALVNGDQVRDTWFYLPPGPVLGYDPRQVDDLLRRVAAELDAEYSARPTVENAGNPEGERHYDGSRSGKERRRPVPP